MRLVTPDEDAALEYYLWLHKNPRSKLDDYLGEVKHLYAEGKINVDTLERRVAVALRALAD